MFLNAYFNDFKCYNSQALVITNKIYFYFFFTANLIYSIYIYILSYIANQLYRVLFFNINIVNKLTNVKFPVTYIVHDDCTICLRVYMSVKYKPFIKST